MSGGRAPPLSTAVRKRVVPAGLICAVFNVLHLPWLSAPPPPPAFSLRFYSVEGTLQSGAGAYWSFPHFNSSDRRSPELQADCGYGPRPPFFVSPCACERGGLDVWRPHMCCVMLSRPPFPPPLTVTPPPTPFFSAPPSRLDPLRRTGLGIFSFYPRKRCLV